MFFHDLITGLVWLKLRELKTRKYFSSLLSLDKSLLIVEIVANVCVHSRCVCACACVCIQPHVLLTPGDSVLRARGRVSQVWKGFWRRIELVDSENRKRIIGDWRPVLGQTGEDSHSGSVQCKRGREWGRQGDWPLLPLRTESQRKQRRERGGRAAPSFFPFCLVLKKPLTTWLRQRGGGGGFKRPRWQRCTTPLRLSTPDSTPSSPFTPLSGVPAHLPPESWTLHSVQGPDAGEPPWTCVPGPGGRGPHRYFDCGLAVESSQEPR